MQRSLLLLAAGLLAMAAPGSALYLEGYVPDTWHDIVLEAREDENGTLELVVVGDENLTPIQSGDHVNYTVRNSVGAEIDFLFESTWHGDDAVDDQGNSQKTTRLLDEVNIPDATEVSAGLQLPNDTLEIRFTVTDGERSANITHELLNYQIMAMEPGGLEEEVDEESEKEDKGAPFAPVALLAVFLVAAAAFVRRL
jgi:hypothetical protein